MTAFQVRADTTVTTHVAFEIPQYINVNWFPENCGHKERREENRDCRGKNNGNNHSSVTSNGDWKIFAGINNTAAAAVAESEDGYLPGDEEIIARMHQTVSIETDINERQKTPSNIILTFIAE